MPMISPKVISFDLDGTLLCGVVSDLMDPEIPPLVSPSGVREDRLRRGAASLLRSLAAEGYLIWIYTESMRGRTPMLEWFKGLEIPIEGMINRPLHEAAWQEKGFPAVCPRKCPLWFGIDVHVDNDPEVAREGEELGFQVILTDPDEEDFERSVNSCLREIESPR